MTAALFKEALALVLSHEGGYVNHPRDPGGATNKGVTQRVYDAYRVTLGLAKQSVRGITSGEAAAIYRQQYWNRVSGDLLPAGVDYATFDFAVNSGVSRASRYLQVAAGLKDKDVDGVLGNKTLAAINAISPERLIAMLCANRMAFVRGLNTFDAFGRGWTRRIMGAADGFQASDTGVIDYAINFARAKPKALPLPTYIGGKAGGEPQTAKALAKDLTYMPTVHGLVSYEIAKAQGWGLAQ